MFELGVYHFQRVKLAVHISQLVLLAVAGILCIVVFRSSASSLGRVGWYFGLIFLTLPAIIYLTLTTRFARTLRFANPYAFVGVDLLFTLAWLTAFAAVASWNSSGKCGSGCGVSKAVVALGVLVWLLFIPTSFMSIYACMYYRREGHLPGMSSASGEPALIDPDKDAFTTMPHDEYTMEHGHGSEDHEDHPAGPSYFHGSSVNDAEECAAPSYSPPTYDGPNFAAYRPPRVDDDTEHMGYGGRQGTRADVDDRVRFPEGRYDEV